MRSFVYLAKDNQPYYGHFVFGHPDHPIRENYVFHKPSQAWLYAAEVAAGGQVWKNALAYLKRTVGPIAFVPVPSSGTTVDTINGQWGPRGFAECLAEKIGGRVVIAAVNRVASERKRGKPAAEIHQNHVWYDTNFRSDETVVYVDDVLTWGRHIAALDVFLGKPRGALGISVACTDGTHQKSAVAPRIRSVTHSGLNDELIKVAEFER